MNVFLRNPFKELPWRFNLSFCRPDSGCLWAAGFTGPDKMNNVPPSCKAKTFCCIPQWLIYHTLKIPPGTQYLQTRNTLITIINPASSPWGWRAGLAPCRRRRDYPDPFGQMGKGFLFTPWEQRARKAGDAQAPCSPWPDPEFYFFKWHVKKKGTERGVAHKDDASAPVSSIFLLVKHSFSSF